MPEKLSYLNKISIKKDSRNRSLYEIDKKHISKSKIKLRAIYLFNDANETKITKLEPADSLNFFFTYAYRSNEKDNKSLDNLTELCRNTECFYFLEI